MQSRLDLIDDWLGLARRAGYDAARLAAHCGVTRRWLDHFFLENFGFNPGFWMHQVRMWDAFRLLAEGRSIKEACFELQFKSKAHFLHRFKRHFKCTPSEMIALYRKNQSFRAQNREHYTAEQSIPQLLHEQPWKLALETLTRRRIQSAATADLISE